MMGQKLSEEEKEEKATQEAIKQTRMKNQEKFADSQVQNNDQSASVETKMKIKTMLTLNKINLD